MSRPENNQVLEQLIPSELTTAKPTIALVDAAAIIVGLVIGAGIFETPALVAANAGNEFAVLLIWMAGGAISLIGALCYAELATAYPHVGGNYLEYGFGLIFNSVKWMDRA